MVLQGILRNRYLFSRRLSQGLILLLFVGGNVAGLQILQGNLSTSKLFGAVHLADPFAVLQIAASGSVVTSQALLGALLVLVLFALIGARMFCSWVCPLNAVTDLANWLRKRLIPDGPHPVIGLGRNARYWAIAVSLVLSAVLGIAAFEWISPISMLHRGVIFGMGMGWTAVLAVFLLDLFVLRHGFCGHICPLGGFYAVAGRYSLLRVRHDRGKCSLCMRCIENCPERQVLSMIGRGSGLVLSGECTNCAKCIEVCEDRAMKFGIRSPVSRGDRDGKQ